jgi:hypothetical protein
VNEITKDCAKGVGLAVAISIACAGFVLFCYGILSLLINLKEKGIFP